ncbi:MAG: PDDEXK nuclease domain-containing protein [Muribaculaceae bacterium]|nr:PDDEXK nuclease domain-containing protein [Muribaculaceae bacterium]
MRQAFPEIRGFSLSNIKYMKQWYSFYYERIQIGQRVVGQFESPQSLQKLGQIASADARNTKDTILEMPELFGRIPWGQHIEIISKCQSLDEAIFYMKKVSEEGWSRSFLESQIEAKLFRNQGAALTNFEKTLPFPQGSLAKEILKDPYHFDFLSMTPEYGERDLEEALVANITQFLLELGKGFSFVGRQMELQMPGGQSFFPDLVFYHIPQHRYVIIELKAVKYIPEFAGKLNFYVTAADELLRGEGDNPSVGLIICKSTDKTVVEWSLKDINKPLGVATYQLQEVVDRTVAELELKAKR